MGVVEIGPRVWRIESLIGARNLFQSLIAGEEASLIVDTGTSATPRDAIVPALRHVGLPAEAVRFIVVTHPDLDHQGGLAGLRETLPRALTACGFADRGLVSDPERLLSDRYGVRDRARPRLHRRREGVDSRALWLPMLGGRDLRGRRGDRPRRPTPGRPARTGSLGRTS